MAKSKKPSGLKITRNGNNFVCEWKIPSAKYGDGQEFTSTPGGKASVSKTATSKTVTVNLANYYPSGSVLKTFSFSVRGNTDKNKNDNKGWSAWNSASFAIYPPKQPSLTVELTESNKCKFSWSVADATADSAYPFTRVVIQYKLVKDCTWEPSQDNWANATQELITSASSYKEITENSSAIADGNYTRLFRVWAQGPGGNSAVTYGKHVYGSPKKAVQSSGEVTDTPGGHDVKVNWDTEYDNSTPIDETTVEWVIVTPASDMSCPSGQTWTAGQTIKDTSGKESVHLSIDSQVGADKCLYTRVNTKHDAKITYGTPVLQKVGPLSNPTGLSVENVSQEAQTAKITATNASSVSGTVIEVIYRKNDSETIVGLITGSPNYLTVKCPAWEDTDNVSFGVRAVLPKTTSSKTTDGVTIYTIDAYMKSDEVWQSGSAAVAPGKPSLSIAGGDVRAAWVNNWSDANLIELSWSENENAWESTDQPDTYTIDNPFTTAWRISGLNTGTTWYVRVRSVKDSGDGKVYSPYSPVSSINLSSSPNTPTLALSQGIVTIGQGLTASWQYESTDGTTQAEARIFEYSSGSYTQIGRTSTDEYIDLPGWDSAGTHQICVEVVSESGCVSEKSGLVIITVADPASCSMSTSLSNATDADKGSFKELTSLPLTVTVTGAGAGGNTSVTLERAEDYHLERPDEDESHGNAGETIFDTTQIGESQISIGLDDLIGTLDDGARYRLVAMVTDNLGQTASQSIDFEVHWSHQALVPSGDVIIDSEEMVAAILPAAPTGAISSDTCDIYRLSSDKPALIFKGAEFGEKYIDPYPAIGENGGYRLVFVTANGDYNTAENVLAFFDAEDEKLHSNSTVIDFDGDRVILNLDMDVSSEWKKDFTQKKYLGGSVRGYWKKGVERQGNIAAVSIPSYEEGLLASMRSLSEYLGVCHVRTPEGSSFPANVSVSESWDKDKAGKVVSFTLKVDRIESQEYDGMTYSEWSGGA